jgi:GNAT superfamily N-acetyltransferase
MTRALAVTVVPLAPSRIEKTARLFHRVWHETQARFQDPRIARYRDLDFFLKRVAERQARTLVAIRDDHCRGFAAWTGPKLNSLFVDGASRRLGIGGLLCDEAEKRMAADGWTEYCLDCLEGNDAARRFYEARGWRVASLEVLKSETPEGLCRVGAWRMMKP